MVYKGFSSNNGPIFFGTLFVANFNFLRPHSALDNVPVLENKILKYFPIALKMS